VWAIVYTLLKAGRVDDILKMGQEIQKGCFVDDLKAYLGLNLRHKLTWRGESS